MQKGKFILAVMIVLAVCTGIACAKPAVSVGMTSGNGVLPALVTGNPGCPDAGCSGTDYKIESTSGDYSGTYFVDKTHFITIRSFIVQGQDAHNAINWTSNFDIGCILVKGSTGADVYCYNPGIRSDTFLTPPKNPSQKPAALSHIDLCFQNPPVTVPEFPAGFVPLTGFAGICILFVLTRRE